MKEKDLLSIAKFSEYTGIKQSVLRHYDEVGLFKPAKRDENGYRYYSPKQTISVNLINVMHNVNIPIKTIKEFTKHRNPGQILNLFREQELSLNRELQRIQQAYSIIHIYKAMIYEGLDANEQEISIRQMAAIPIEIGPVNDFSSGYLYESYRTFLELMDERNISSAYPAGGYYEDMDSFIKSNGQPDRYFNHTPNGHDIKNAGEYLVGYNRGFYGCLGDLPERMKKYADEHQLSFTGPVYEIYLFDEVVIDDPDQYLIQISVPVKRP